MRFDHAWHQAGAMPIDELDSILLRNAIASGRNPGDAIPFN